MFYEELKVLKEKYEALSLGSGDNSQFNNQNIVPGYQQLQKQRSEILPSGQSQTFTGQDLDNSGKKELLGQSHNESNNSNEEEDLYEIAKRVHEQQKRRYLFTDLSDSNNNECLVIKHKRQNPPKYRTYSNEDVRSKSFQGWKSESERPTLHFAMSGFFYRGKLFIHLFLNNNFAF
ncbi:Hypothetical predicted protein [Mytilus galloprovincialis]|uniref:Uncharacterized protein n=1 Tax=Mytilus galloprovincialis TaxID=29158 RepID=A0A8B6GZ19_MYTGA|nr:Hypothetical predicted protein [Mytilus galloprovincialis]